jgi:hypothetical protein
MERSRRRRKMRKKIKEEDNKRRGMRRWRCRIKYEKEEIQLFFLYFFREVVSSFLLHFSGDVSAQKLTCCTKPCLEATHIHTCRGLQI